MSPVGPAAPAELDLLLPVEPPSVPAARRAVESVARAAGACPGTVEALRLAVSEACTNVVLHAYREDDQAGRMHVRAVAEGDDLRVVICDHGVGFLPRPDSPGMGLGLPLMGQLTEELEVGTSGGANRVAMRFRLDRPPPVFAAVADGATASAAAG